MPAQTTSDRVNAERALLATVAHYGPTAPELWDEFLRESWTWAIPEHAALSNALFEHAARLAVSGGQHTLPTPARLRAYLKRPVSDAVLQAVLNTQPLSPPRALELVHTLQNDTP